MRHVAAIPAVAVLAGSAAGILVPDIPPLVAIGLFVWCAAAAVLAYRFNRERLFVSCVVASFVIGGALLASNAWRDASRPALRQIFDEVAQAQRAEADANGRVLPEDDSASATVEGVLRNDAAPGSSGVSLSVAVEFVRSAGLSGPPIRASGGILVTVVGIVARERIGEWRAGRRVRFPVDLHRPARYLDAGVPDGERALAMRGTTLVGTVKSGALVDIVSHASRIEEHFACVRALARHAIDDGVGRWNSRSAGIVNAIVIGDRAGLDDEVQRRLQEAGTFHVIAISGGNIAILAGLMLGGFRIAGLLGRTAMLSAMLALIYYAYLVGGGASVIRATLMALVFFGARAIDQRSPPVNALAVIAAFLAVAQPFSISDPAFVLTCGATLAILLVAPSVPRDRLPHGVRSIAAMFAASVAVEAMLLPVGAWFFSRVTFAGLALNFLAIPLMGVAQIFGMALVPISFVSTSLAGWFGFIAHLGAEGLVWSADLVRFAPGVTFRVARPSWTVVLIYYVALMTWWFARRRRLPAMAAIVAAIWIVAEPWTMVVARGDGRLHVTFLDVGQGDAAFVRFPHGSTLLVDSGGLGGTTSFDIGDRVVAPVLRLAGVRRLDYLVVTHGDPDHIGGAPSILREFRPRHVWEGIPVPRAAPLNALRTEAQAQRLDWLEVRAGQRTTMDGVELTVWHPREPDWERQRVRNDDSVVLELRWRDVSFVLTGDIGRAIEHTLAARIPPARLRVLKVPHHGSLTSSTPEFIRSLSPTLAVFSVGRSNRFGHPAPEVLNRYHDEGSAIFRTDRDGAIDVDTDGERLMVTTFSGATKIYEPQRTQRTQRTEGTRGTQRIER